MFGGAAAEFVMLPQFGSSTYFLLTLLALVDFLSSLALRVRRSTRAVAVPTQKAPEPAASEPPRHEPSTPAPAPTPMPAVPTAAPVAESTLKSAPEQVAVHPETNATEQHPEVPAPGIQPGSGTPPDQQR